MAAENERQENRERSEPSSRETPQGTPARAVDLMPEGAPDLSAEELERRALLLERFTQACEAIDEAVAHLPAKERERLQREWIEDVDDAIRQQAIRLIRQAS